MHDRPITENKRINKIVILPNSRNSKLSGKPFGRSSPELYNLITQQMVKKPARSLPQISQVLGHNEHLYVKLPKGFWSAHVIMGAGVTMEAVLLLLAPSIASSLGVTPHLDEDATPAARVAGAALAGLCVFVWSLLGTSDKHYARTMLLSMITYHVLAVCVAGAAAFTEDDADAVDEYRLAMVVALRAAMCLLCLAYFYSIAGYTPIRGQKPSGFPQSSCSRKEN
ncbi:uncharacterized protein LOC125042077 [Penaeus chinensis]|uniref:uncharacterized protein LOC125042077 n=1 Tax=Penaeus chinensis TaxID=139456 RepID=UPI001FB70A43|nr:uncharacterized protein LOC125042077 [Penaeus chinensis]